MTTVVAEITNKANVRRNFLEKKKKFATKVSLKKLEEHVQLNV